MRLFSWRLSENPYKCPAAIVFAWHFLEAAGTLLSGVVTSVLLKELDTKKHCFRVDKRRACKSLSGGCVANWTEPSQPALSIHTLDIDKQYSASNSNLTACALALATVMWMHVVATHRVCAFCQSTPSMRTISRFFSPGTLPVLDGETCSNRA
jgi:hypothetical protein